MGIWRRRSEEVVSSAPGAPAPAPSAATDAEGASASFDVIDPTGMVAPTTLDDYIFRTGRITLDEAMRVPAVKRAHDLICGSTGQFDLGLRDPQGRPPANYKPNPFEHPEPGIAPSVTWSRVIRDLLFFERAWLVTHSYGWHGRVAEWQRLDADTVTVQPKRVYYAWGSAEVWPDIPGLTRIDSPTKGLLDSSPAIRACIALERAALNYIKGAPPMSYFTPKDEEAGNRWADSDEVREKLLDPWEVMRAKSATGWVPFDLSLVIPGWDPEKLQLDKVRQAAVLEVARLTGIDAEDLSVSTTSRTYFNGQDRRRARVEDVLGMYMKAIEGRLSMDDVSPAGYTASFDTTGYLRLDDLAAAQADSVLVAAQVLTRDEARAKRGLEPLGEPAQPTNPADVGNALAIAASIEPRALPAPKPKEQPA